MIFQPKAGEVVSPCTSLFIALEESLSSDPSVVVLRPITPVSGQMMLMVRAHDMQSISYDAQTLILMTNAGHCILGRYHRTQVIRDLNQSMKYFERSYDLCPADHPCCPAALVNLAMGKFIGCQVNGTYLDLDHPISLLHDALDLRPIGHPDRPTTQPHLAIALLSRFARRGFQADADVAKELLNEVVDVCHAKSHIHRSALLAIKTSVLHPAGSIDANDLPAKETITLPLTVNELACRLKLCQDIEDPYHFIM
jgi:hypothetical protein